MKEALENKIVELKGKLEKLYSKWDALDNGTQFREQNSLETEISKLRLELLDKEKTLIELNNLTKS